MELYRPSLKNVLYFRKGHENHENIKYHIFCLLRENFPNIGVKGKSFSFVKKGKLHF